MADRTKTEHRDEISQRLDKAFAAGISETDIIMAGQLLQSVTSSMNELGVDRKQAAIVGLSMGIELALASEEAAREFMRAIGIMLDETSAFDHLQLETIQLYLRKRSESLAREHGIHGR